MSAASIGFVGMTHLGVNSAAAVAERGFDVVCFDSDAGVISRLAEGVPPVTEPGLADCLTRNRQRMCFSSDTADLGRCDVVYIAADVPTDDSGTSELRSIRTLIEIAAANLSPQAVLVVLCQVPPGFTRALPVDASRLYYQVETLIFGCALERALHPERFIIGCADPKAALPPAYGALLAAFDCPILPMRYESAELAKISINFCLVASISVANTLAELCEHVGADWSEIVPALRLDRRIGQHAYLAPGLGIAGGNLERDLATVLRLATAEGTNHDVVDAWIANSRHRKGWAFRTLSDHVLARTPDPLIAVLGLAYKADTHSTKNSPALALISALAGKRVRAYDPVVPVTAVPGVEGAEGALAAVANADVVAVMTPWPAFREITADDLSRLMAGRCILDPYRVFDGPALLAAGFRYFTLGATPQGVGLGVERNA